MITYVTKREQKTYNSAQGIQGLDIPVKYSG